MNSSRIGHRALGELRDTRRPADGHRFCTPVVRETPLPLVASYGSAW